MEHLIKVRKLGYDKTNPINDLTDIKNIKFLLLHIQRQEQCHYLIC